MRKIIYRSIILLISLAFFLSACNSKELSRSQLQKLIEVSSDYKKPFALQLMQGNIVNMGESLVSVEDAATASIAEKVDVERYFEEHPQIAVANHLGLVEVRVKAMNLEESKDRFMDGGSFWHLDAKYLPTEKAKDLWKQYDLPPSQDSIPLAEKQITEITGITKRGEDAAQAQFSWKFVPNEVGKTFDTTTSEFKSLPVNLQQLLDGTLPPNDVVFKRRNHTMSFAAVRQGQAVFRRYDDGWRLEAVMFQ